MPATSWVVAVLPKRSPGPESALPVQRRLSSPPVLGLVPLFVQAPLSCNASLALHCPDPRVLQGLPGSTRGPSPHILAPHEHTSFSGCKETGTTGLLDAVERTCRRGSRVLSFVFFPGQAVVWDFDEPLVSDVIGLPFLFFAARPAHNAAFCPSSLLIDNLRTHTFRVSDRSDVLCLHPGVFTH